MQWRGIGLVLLLWHAAVALAGDVEIVMTEFRRQGDTWQVNTTLRHADTGWEHYANAWRVVTDTGEVLGTRPLLHPHAEEQPFTRSLDGLIIPAGVTAVYVEAHDTVHGWSPQRVRVELHHTAGERFRVQR